MSRSKSKRDAIETGGNRQDLQDEQDGCQSTQARFHPVKSCKSCLKVLCADLALADLDYELAAYSSSV